MTETEATEKKTTPKGYYIVNPAGAVHIVDKAHAARRLKQTGWRKATKAEQTRYHKTRVQRHDRPIAKPFNPDPDAE